MAIPQQAKEQIERFLADGDKLGAIRHLRDNYKFSLDESRRLVDALQAQYVPKETQSAGNLPNASLDDLSRAHIAQLIAKGEKIDAVKYVKNRFNISLKDARTTVEEVGKQLRYKPASSLDGPFVRWTILFFCALGIGFTTIAGTLYISQSHSIANSELITGRVVDINSRGKGLTAPVIEYEWNGRSWLYASSSYSTADLYALDDEIPLYVNREQPEDVTPDTFLDRWLLIVVLGTLGVCFIVGPLVVYFIAFR